MFKNKKITLILLIIWLLLILVSIFFWNQHLNHITNFRVYAQTNTNGNVPSLQQTMYDIINFLQPLLKLIYLIMRPLLVVAWMAMDNTFVYWEFLHLDSPLIQMRNMSKNFANFALLIFILAEIFQWISGGWNTKSMIKNILKWAVIAWIWINVSWFVMGALIDLSTILTYSIWWLPMTLIKNSELGKTPILWVETTMNLTEDSSVLNNFNVFYTRWDKKFAPCKEHKKFIIWPTIWQTKWKEIEWLDNKYCMYQNNFLVDIQDLLPKWSDDKPIMSVKNNEKNQKKVDDFYQSIKEWKIWKWDLKWLIYMWYTDKQWKSYFSWALIKLDLHEYKALTKQDLISKDGLLERQNVFAKSNCNTQEWTCYWWKWTYLWDLIKNSKWFVWPLVTLYTSLLNLWNLHISEVGWGWSKMTYATFFEFLLKAVVGILLIFPLLAMAIVFVIRIGMLWFYIVLSPFIALILGFSKNSIANKIKSTLKLDPKQILWTIFAPVASVFWLSMSILFLYTLQNSIYINQWQSLRNWLWLKLIQEPTQNKECLNILWITKICYQTWSENSWGSFTLDLFTRLIMNWFGIAVVRVLMFAAMKSTWFSKGIIDNIERIWKKAIGAAPVIPIPWVWAVWAWAIGNVIWGNWYSWWLLWSLKNSLSKKINDDSQKIQEFFTWKEKPIEKVVDDIKDWEDINKTLEDNWFVTSNDKINAISQIHKDYSNKISKDKREQILNETKNRISTLGNEEEKLQAANNLASYFDNDKDRKKYLEEVAKMDENLIYKNWKLQIQKSQTDTRRDENWKDLWNDKVKRNKLYNDNKQNSDKVNKIKTEYINMIKNNIIKLDDYKNLDSNWIKQKLETDLKPYLVTDLWKTVKIEDILDNSTIEWKDNKKYKVTYQNNKFTIEEIENQQNQ